MCSLCSCSLCACSCRRSCSCCSSVDDGVVGVGGIAGIGTVHPFVVSVGVVGGTTAATIVCPLVVAQLAGSRSERAVVLLLLLLCTLQRRVWVMSLSLLFVYRVVGISITVKPKVSNQSWSGGYSPVMYTPRYCSKVSISNCQRGVASFTKQREKNREKPSQTARRAFRVSHSCPRLKNAAFAVSPVRCWMCGVGGRNERGKFVSAGINNATQVGHFIKRQQHNNIKCT